MLVPRRIPKLIWVRFEKREVAVFAWGKIDKKQLRMLGSVGTIGLELGLSLLFGVKAGEWLDGKFGTAPVMTRIGLVLGIAAGARALYRVAMKARAEMQNDAYEDLSESNGPDENHDSSKDDS